MPGDHQPVALGAKPQQRQAQERRRRQIERLFKRHLNCVPKRYYLQMRLRRARELLLQTSMPIIDITTACGFQSPPHFSRCYRAQFGCPPSAERMSRQGKVLGATRGEMTPL